MKEHIKVFTGSNEVQWLYSQDWEYHDYGNCKRYLQIIFPYYLFRVQHGINKRCITIFRNMQH